MPHDFLIQRATHLRPPSTITATASGEVTTARSAYSQVATAVPLRIGVKSAFLKQGEYGQQNPADYIGHTDGKRDVRVRDVFEIGSDRYEVRGLGNVGGFLRSFDLAKVILP
jgi:hypothetical protein